MVDDPDPVQPVSRDPDDDYLVALALQSGAEAIDSGDLDLREALGLPVEVLTPRRSPETRPGHVVRVSPLNKGRCVAVDSEISAQWVGWALPADR